MAKTQIECKRGVAVSHRSANVGPIQSPDLDPPSLRRRAPARIDIALKSGRCLRIGGKRMHLSAGRIVVVQATTPTPSTQIEITAEPPLHTIVPATQLKSGAVPIYHSEFSGRLMLRIVPIPATAKLHVTTIDGRLAPLRITIPIMVWPSRTTLLIWWLLTLVSVAGLRIQRVVLFSDSLGEAIASAWRDLPFLLGLLVLTFLVLLPLQMLGWVISLMESIQREE